MTTKTMSPAKTREKRTQFPDFPPRLDVQNWLNLYRRSFPAALGDYLGSPETTITATELPVAPSLDTWENHRIPDLFVSYNANIALFIEQNGYAIDRQGKPPDFVLEVASPTTGIKDYTEKRCDYERYGVLEYWRFDASGGKYHDVALAGDRLVDGRYVPIEIEWLDDRHARGYSDALGLYLCWEYGELRWYDPVAGDYLQTYEEEAARADREAARADQESARAAQESARAARAEAELRRLRQKLDDDEPDK